MGDNFVFALMDESMSSMETVEPTPKLEVGEELLSETPRAYPSFEAASLFNVSFDYEGVLTSAERVFTPSSSPGSGSLYDHQSVATMGDFAYEIEGRAWTPWDTFNHHWKMEGGSYKYELFDQQANVASNSFFQPASPTGFNVIGAGGSQQQHEYVPRTPKPMLSIIPERCVYLTKHYAKFLIQPLDIPSGIVVLPDMIKATVETPSGFVSRCHIKDAIGRPGWFTGAVKGPREVGAHQLRVRLEVPKKLLGPKQLPAVEQEAVLLVAQNYYKESMFKKSSFEVDYMPWITNATPPKGRRFSFSGNQEGFAGSKAWGLTCDRGTNRLFYTDRAGQSLSCVDPNGQVIFKSCPPLHSIGSLNRPTGICFDEANRRLLVVDKDNHRICFFTLDGQYISAFGGVGYADGAVHYPWDVAVSPTGDKIIVTDSRNHRLQLFDRFGNFVRKFSIFERNPFEYKNHLDYPRGVTFNSDGSLVYATDFSANNILEIAVNYYHVPRKVLPQGMIYRPQGIAVDAVDCLLVCDSKTKALWHMNPGNGRCLSQIRTVGKEELQSPLNVAMMAGHNVAVLDSEAKIRIF